MDFGVSSVYGHRDKAFEASFWVSTTSHTPPVMGRNANNDAGQ